MPNEDLQDNGTIQLASLSGVTIENSQPAERKSIASTIVSIRATETVIDAKDRSSLQTPTDSLPNSKRPNGAHSGWIDGVYICARASACIFILYLVLIATAAGLARQYPSDNKLSGSRLFYRDVCTKTKKWDTTIHFVINALSTGILAAGNYAMQTLVAPTREEIDFHHARRRWLDVGSASVRNLFLIGKPRVILWGLLLLTTLPFHFISNSMAFQSMEISYSTLLVGPKDLDPLGMASLTTPGLQDCFGPVFSERFGIHTPSWEDIVSRFSTGRLARIDHDECMDVVSGPYWTDLEAVILLSDNLTVRDGGDDAILMLVSNYPGVNLSDSSPSALATPFSYGSADNSTECVHKEYETQPHAFSSCLLLEHDTMCELRYLPSMCITIIISAFIKVMVMFFTARTSHALPPPLLTAYDAVASFLSRPDPTTEGLCWVSENGIRRGDWKYALNPPSHAQDLGLADRTFELRHEPISKPKRWWQASTKSRWIVLALLCSVCLTMGVYYQASSKINMFGPDSRKNMFDSGVWDSPKGYTKAGADRNVFWESGVKTQVIVANLPQLIVTICYFIYNNVLSAMLAAAEWTSYGAVQKSLRVTWPVEGSKQKSTYWLNVPYKYGIPLQTVYMLLHWLISQSFFPILVTSAPGDSRKNKFHYVIGLSDLALFCFSILMGLTWIFMAGMAFRKFKSWMPLVGSCSAAISAACHPPMVENLDALPLGLVKWGETRTPPVWIRELQADGQHGHCSFTSLGTDNPSQGRLYA